MALFIAFAASLVQQPASADTNDGILALGRGDYPAAVKILTPAAEHGDWASQSLLAHTYSLMEEYETAYAWYYAAAECGSLDAKIELSMLVEKMAPERIAQGKRLGRDYHRRYCKR